MAGVVETVGLSIVTGTSCPRACFSEICGTGDGDGCRICGGSLAYAETSALPLDPLTLLAACSGSASSNLRKDLRLVV